MASDIIALDAAVEAQPEIPAPVLITAEPTGSVVKESVNVDPEAALEPKDGFVWRPQAPIFTPGEAATELAAPAPAPDPQEDAVKRKAVELLKEALQKAAAAPLVPHPKVEVLKTLCLCICKLAKEGNTIFGELTQILPKLGVSHLAPLLSSPSRQPRGGGLGAAADTKAAPPARQRLLGRAKSYNTRKGFGFIELPGFCRDIFVFNSHLIGRVGLIAGEPVEFELVLDDGRPQARNVKVLPKDTPILRDAGAQAQGANEAVKQALLGGVGDANAAAEGGGPQALAGTEAAPQGPDANKQKMGGFQARSQEDILFEKIREAQSAAMKEKRKAKAKASAPPPEGFPEWRGEADPLVLLAATGDTQGLPPRSFVEPRPRDPEASREEEVDKFPDEGNIPKNSKIRVINFPATDVNGSIGVVKGFNARSKKYSIVAELRTGQGDSAMTETVSLQLKEEYMKVLELPPGKTARNLVGGPSTATQTSKQDDELPPLTGAPQTEALRTAASEALRKFHQFAPSAARQPAPGPNPFMGLAAHAHPAAAAAAAAQLGHMGLGSIYPGQAGAAAVAAAAAGGAGVPGVAAAAVGAPPAGGAAGVPVGGLRGPPPGAGMGERGYRKTSPDVRAAGPPSAQTWLAQGSAQAARITSPLRERPQGMQPQGQVSGHTASSQWDMTSGGGQNTASTGARPTGGVPLEQYARDRSVAATMPSAGHSAMSVSQPSRPFADGSRPSGGVAGGKAPAAGQLPQPGPAAASEGQVGQVWRVRASKEFVDVIVRATEEVNSPELRHIGHGEVVIQRGPTVTLKNRLVRMPIKPDGWVTVHAKHIGGPEFLEEVVGELNQKARAAGRASAPGEAGGERAAAAGSFASSGLKQIARAGDGADGGGRRGSPPPPREGGTTGARLPSKGAARAEPRSDDPWLKTLKATAADGSDKDGGQAGREADDPWAKDIVDPWAKPAARRSALEGSRRTAADTASSWGPSYAGASIEGRSFDRSVLLMLRARLLETGRLELEDKRQRIRVLFLPMQEASKRGYRDRRARNGDEEEEDEEEQQQQSAPQQQQQQQSQQQQPQQAQQQQQSAANCPTQ